MISEIQGVDLPGVNTLALFIVLRPKPGNCGLRFDAAGTLHIACACRLDNRASWVTHKLLFLVLLENEVSISID